MGAIAVAAYSYMSLVPLIQPPIMKLCTTKAQRSIKTVSYTHLGVLFGQVMRIATHNKVNPLIGSAGVSAVPMAARVSLSLIHI